MMLLPVFGDLKPGYVHSIESLGTVDGPGVRTVVFLSGCAMRCKYCHNIDVTNPRAGVLMSAEDLVSQVVKNKAYFGTEGGVTFSGGDPLYQTCFLKHCLELCKAEGIHTTVDTSLFTSLKNVQRITPYTDLFMVSIKHLDNQIHKDLTKVSNQLVLENLDWLAQQKKRLWIRYVLIPGLTDSPDYLRRLSAYIKSINAEKVEILPYHKAGVEKWAQMGLRYEFDVVPEPSAEMVNTVGDFFAAQGIETVSTV